jgi:hypothetical protein
MQLPAFFDPADPLTQRRGPRRRETRDSKNDHSPIRPAVRSTTLASIVGGPVSFRTRIVGDESAKRAAMMFEHHYRASFARRHVAKNANFLRATYTIVQPFWPSA